MFLSIKSRRSIGPGSIIFQCCSYSTVFLKKLAGSSSSSSQKLSRSSVSRLHIFSMRIILYSIQDFSSLLPRFQHLTSPSVARHRWAGPKNDHPNYWFGVIDSQSSSINQGDWLTWSGGSCLRDLRKNNPKQVGSHSIKCDRAQGAFGENRYQQSPEDVQLRVQWVR